MTVLVGYTTTAEGDAAFDAGLAEARRRGEPLLLVNTPKGGAPVSAELAPPDRVAALSRRAEDAEVTLELRQEPHEGDLADEIVRLAEAVDASVIVIGLRRRTPVGKLLMGSTAQRILLDAERPVLAVKPRPA